MSSEAEEPVGVNMGSDRDAKRWKEELLEAASAIGNVDLTKALLESGVNISVTNTMGQTPIYNISRNRHLKVL